MFIYQSALAACNPDVHTPKLGAANTELHAPHCGRMDGHAVLAMRIAIPVTSAGILN